MVGGIPLLAALAAAHTPVVVIMSHPTSGHKHQYMAASYVKWIELAGGRVMPLSYYANDTEVDAVFSQANGAVFMGGGAELPKSARRLWSKAMEANQQGDAFPIWGSCLGFEWIMQLASGDDGILSNGFDSENLTLPLNLTAKAASSRLLAPAATMPVPFESPPLTILDALQLNVTMNNHNQGVTPASFDANAGLKGAFNVLATNFDRKGREFISVVEAAQMPVWATQWHPEKNIFEQGVRLPSGQPYEVIQHTRAAVAVAQYVANFFVDQCRLSTHRWASATEEWGSLIYQYTTSLSMAPEFEQVYFFEY